MMIKMSRSCNRSCFGVGVLFARVASLKREKMSTTKEQQPAQPVQLCAFDTERDYPEGEEARQILAYHPEGCSIDDQTSVVGLAQALLTFAGNFDEARTHADVSRQRNRLLQL